MTATRLARCLLVAGIFVLGVFPCDAAEPLPRAVHETPPKEAAGDSTSPAAYAPSRPVVAVIHLGEGDSIVVSYVGPWALNAVRYFSLHGEPGYLSTHKITRVVSTTGTDVTRRVVEDRVALGESGEPPPPSVIYWMTSPFRYASTRGRPYTITELSAMGLEGRSGVGGDGMVSSAGFGGMGPLSRSWSLGGVVHLMTNMNDYHALDAGVRLKHYATDRVSLDLTAGVFTARGYDWDTRGVPPFAEAAVTFADAVSFVARAERATWAGWVRTSHYPPRGFDDRRTRTTWRVGVRLGPSPSWASIPTFLVGVFAFLMVPSEELL